MNDLSGDELKAVFQLCQPNAKGLISLSKLQNLFDQHTNQLNGDPSINNKDLLNDFQDASSNGDEWINFDEFCQGVASLFESPSHHQQQNEFEIENKTTRNEDDFEASSAVECCQTNPNETYSTKRGENLLISLDSQNDLLGGISPDERRHSILDDFETFSTVDDDHYSSTTKRHSTTFDIYSTENDFVDFFSTSTDPAQTLVPRTYSATDSILQDFINPSLNSTKMSRSNGGVTHRSPLRIDVTSSSEDASHNNDEETSPYSLTDSAMGGSAMSPEPLDESHEINGSASAHDKSHCSSMSDDREVNFESYGENNDVEYEHDLVDFDDVDSTVEKTENSSAQRNSTNFVRSRNAWLRTSLRRSPANNDQLVPPKRWGSFRHNTKRVSSNAYASALYHHNGANSSGRSSNCDDGDMQSDISLEDDVIDLNQKVQSLQDQVGKLAESQASTDGRYSIVRQENVTLNQKILALQEQLSEMEQRSEKELADEQKRNRELLARIEREKQLEIENYSIRLQSMERDYNNSAREVIQLRSANDRLKAEKNSLEQELFETQQSLTVLQKEFSQLQDSNKREQEQVVKERRMNEHLVEELSKELETLKSSSFPRGMAPSLSNGIDGHSNSSPASMLNGIASASNGHNSHINDLEDELKVLREKNRRLKEANDELEAVLMNRSLEQGKAVLSQTNREGTSIEMELRNMDDNQDFSDTPFNFEEFCQLRTALKEQQDVNAQLRGYIDGILMNIIDKYPELLEVRK